MHLFFLSVLSEFLHSVIVRELCVRTHVVLLHLFILLLLPQLNVLLFISIDQLLIKIISLIHLVGYGRESNYGFLLVGLLNVRAWLNCLRRT